MLPDSLAVPRDSTAARTAVILIVSGEFAFSLSIYGSTATATGQNIFDTHSFGLIILNTLFISGRCTLYVVAILAVHHFSVDFPSACVLHTILTCM